MRICDGCGLVFHEDEARCEAEVVVAADGYSVRNVPVCPQCGETDTSRAYRCRNCGNYHSSDKISFGLCEDCRNDLQVRFYKGIVGVLRDCFSKRESVWLAENVDVVVMGEVLRRAAGLEDGV